MTFGRDQDAAAAEDYFGERVAARYDELHADMVDSSVVEPAVDFLTRLANMVPRSSPRLQHDQQPDDPGVADRLLPQRREPPRARWTRTVGHHTVAPSPAAMTARVALAQADTVLVWDPADRRLIAANLRGTMPWTEDPAIPGI
jgi:hypothetical protein